VAAKPRPEAKRPVEELLGLRTGNDVLRLLSGAGFSVDATIKSLFGNRDMAGALLVGSIAEGYQTAASDVDIMLVTYASREEVRASSELLIEPGRSLEFLAYPQGIEVNTEIICRNDFDALAQTLDRMVGSSAMGGVSTLPMFDKYTLRLLHRLRTGLILSAEDIVEEFRADFHVESLPLYTSVLYLVLAREALEDARTSSWETVGLVEFTCRDVLEHCLLALAASVGFTSPTRRFVMNWMADLPEHAEHLDALLNLRASLLNRSVLTPNDKQDTIDDCVRHYTHVAQCLREDPVRRKIIDEIFCSITYAD